MFQSEVFTSPDKKIKKITVFPGDVGQKPTENCECYLEITNCEMKIKNPYVIGDSDGEFERLLDKCLVMMSQGEISNVTFNMKEKPVEFTIHLSSFVSNGLIYEWDARFKFNLATKHKDRGVSLFQCSFIDASHRFSKALKLLASIPIDVSEDLPNEIDGILFDDICNLKTILYNNLASCYLKHHDYEIVIKLCTEVISVDPDNVKALYKLGVAYAEVKDFEQSYKFLKKAAIGDPKNRAVVNKMRLIATKVNEMNSRVNAMVKKMFEH